MAADGLERWLRRLVLRSQLEPDDRAAILALPHEVLAIAANRDFVRLGEHTRHACLVVEGLVGRFGQSSTGARQISAVHIPGDMVDLHSVVAPLSGSALSALSSATILRVPHQAMKDVADAHPRLARAFWRDCVVDAAVLAETILNIGRRPAATRVAHLLCELAVRFAVAGVGDGLSFPLMLNQINLGDATGLTSVHVNRTLRQLRDAGLVTVANRVATVTGWRGLARAGDFDPLYLDLPADVLDAILSRFHASCRA